MYNCNDFYSLSVLSIYEGELLGVVDKLYFSENLKKVVEIGLLCENGANLRLSTKNIYKIGKNAITIKNNQLVNFSSNNNLLACPINSKAYSLNGEFLGIINEVVINEKFSTLKITLDNEQVLEPSRIATVGKNTVVFYDDRKPNIKKFNPKSPKILKSEIVEEASILPVEELNKESKEEPQEVKTNIQTSDLLIGRICTKDIFNFNNELLVKENSKLTKKQLKEVIKFGKLRELMLYLK